MMMMITGLVAGGITGFIAYLIAHKKTTFDNALGIAMITGVVTAGMLGFVLYGVTEDKGDVVVKSKEKIASTEEAVSVIEKGWIYKHDKDNQLIQCSIDNLSIYVDESADGLYIEEKYKTMGIFKTATRKVLVIPESIEAELYERNND